MSLLFFTCLSHLSAVVVFVNSICITLKDDVGQIFCNTDCRRPASVWNIPGLIASFQFLWRPHVMFVLVSGHCFSAGQEEK